MSVVYMKKLEDQPQTYAKSFSSLTKQINIETYKWIMQRIPPKAKILEIGCGPGNFTRQLAINGYNIEAIDSNPAMIEFANQENHILDDLISKPKYQVGNALSLSSLYEKESFDVIISTFMLSELRPLEQQILLRQVWSLLKPNGKFLLAAEFQPTGFNRIIFEIKRRYYQKKIGKIDETTNPLRAFYGYPLKIGFSFTSEGRWTHDSIRTLELIKKPTNNNLPGYYQPPQRRYKGLWTWMRAMRCLLTGQVDKVPIEPGIYEIGSPTPDSPIIVSANYDYTYIHVCKDLQKLNAWLLCVDSRGINVWCAARGGEFGNKQLIEVVEATGIRNRVSNNTIILPQLAAGGIEAPKLPMNTKEFPFTINYGPVWSKDLPEYLEKKIIRKPEHMKLATFTPFHRFRAFLSHTTFLYRKIFALPLLGLLLLLLIVPPISNLRYIGDFIGAIILVNFIIAMGIPLTNFTRKYLTKSHIFGIINLFVLGGLNFLIYHNIVFTLFHLCFFYWLGFFSTMSFSGYTMATSPREIQAEYLQYKKISRILLWGGIILSMIGVCFF